MPPLGAHAVKHLELEALRVNARLPSDLDRGLNTAIVMGRNAGVIAAQDKSFGELIIVGIDFRFILEGYVRRFFVGSLAQPDSGSDLD